MTKRNISRLTAVYAYLLLHLVHVDCIFVMYCCHDSALSGVLLFCTLTTERFTLPSVFVGWLACFSFFFLLLFFSFFFFFFFFGGGGGMVAN